WISSPLISTGERSRTRRILFLSLQNSPTTNVCPLSHVTTRASWFDNCKNRINRVFFAVCPKEIYFQNLSQSYKISLNISGLFGVSKLVYWMCLSAVKIDFWRS